MLLWTIYVAILYFIKRRLIIFISSAVVWTVCWTLKIVLHIWALKWVRRDYSIVILRHICRRLKHVGRRFQIIIIHCIINWGSQCTMNSCWRLSSLIVRTFIRIWRVVLRRRIEILSWWKMSSILRILIWSICSSRIVHRSSPRDMSCWS